MQQEPVAMASDYRGHAAAQETNSLSQVTPVKSYSSAISSKVRPKKEQAVILESVEGCTNDDYIDGLEQLCDPVNIRYISKISGGRVCVFLTNYKIVDKIVNKIVQVKGYGLRVRPLIEKNKRVVISNVNPVIPDVAVLDALKKAGIQPESNITDLRASLNKPGRAHILSFRRQVYIKEEDESILPETMQITFDNTNYWIYFSTEVTRCFICKQNGHIAKSCPNSDSQVRIEEEQIINNKRLSVETNEERKSNKDKSIPVNKALKRPPPPSTVSDVNSDTNSGNEEIQEKRIPPVPKNKEATFVKPELKKMRNNEGNKEEVLSEMLLTAKIALQNSEKAWALNFTQIQEFLEKSIGCTNTLELSREYTDDTEGLTEMLEHIYPHIHNRALKSRITRMKKKLLPTLKDDSDLDSDSSQISLKKN